MSEFLQSFDIAPELVVFIGSMIPILELRGAIPIGIAADLPWYEVYLIAVVGNMLPVPVILIFMDLVVSVFSHIPACKRFFDFVFEKTTAKVERVEKYQEIGLTIFTAIPLPITGAWTASIAAKLFNFGRRKSFLCILLGVMISGVIVTALSLLGWVGAIIAGVVLIGLAVFYILRKKNKRSESQPDNE